MASTISETSGSIPDDSTYMSEDSESTQESDLDHDLIVDVLLPDNTVQKTTIAASTPWSDLQTQLFSQFKLSPSSYVVEYISSSSYKLKQRRASRSVGKMDITMITIQSKQAAKHVVTPHPISNNKENTVRLIIRLARLRQSIIRVNPDVPLSNIFETVCTKLKLNPEAQNYVEFHHPVQHGVKLNLNLSLNHYNLREIYLAEKADNNSKSKLAPHSGKTKRKAPPPPRPAPPNPAALSHIKTPSSETETKTTTEPVYAKVQKKPKPAKRRAAPRPPAEDKPPGTDDPKTQPKQPTPVDTAVDTTTEQITEDKNQQDLPTDPARNAIEALDTVIEEETGGSEHVDDQVKINSAINPATPTRPPRKHRHLKTSLDEDLPEIPSQVKKDVPDSVDEQSSCREESVYEVIDDVSVTQMKNESVAKEEMDDEAADVIELFNNVIEETESDNESLGQFDDVLKELDDVTNDVVEQPDDVIEPTKSIDSSKIHTKATAMKFGDIIVYDVTDDEISSDQDEAVMVENDKNASLQFTSDGKSEDRLTETLATQEESGIQFDDHPSPPPSLYEKENPPPQVKEDQNSHIVEKLQEELRISEITTLPSSREDSLIKPQQQNGFVKKVKEEDDGFDLHIAESFDIPIRSIDDEKKMQTNGRLPEPIRKNSEEKTKIEKMEDLPLSEKKNEDAEVSGSEKTVMEIEKLHLRIKRMRDRNSVKQNQIDSKRNTWQPGSHSFTFVPEKKKEFSHTDYKVAPVGGIELSTDGEIKTNVSNPSSKPEKPVEQSAPKLRSTLPSYYKKFLGVQAFAAGGSGK